MHYIKKTIFINLDDQSYLCHHHHHHHQNNNQKQETENVTTGNDWIYENDEMGDYLAFLAHITQQYD